jgi:transposase-like protein
MRDYGRVVDQLSDSFGLSAPTISREFKERTRERLVEFEQRSWDGFDFVALYVDGKYLAGEQIIIVLGVTIEGDKKVLGSTQASTENAKSIAELFRSLIERGLAIEQGMLLVIDGGKGLKKAIDEVFGDLAVIQRCQWHKRENILSYLSEAEQDNYRDRLKGAYYKPTYKAAKAELDQIHKDLEQVSRSAANSLAEGLEHTLTLHRLGLNKYFRKSFCTTNCIESLNSGLEKYLHKIKRWTNTDQRHRWVAAGLLAQEKRLRKVINYKKLHYMKEAVSKEIQHRQNAKGKEPLIFN